VSSHVRQDLGRPAVLYHSLVPADAPGVSPFGRQVRRWCAIRRMSQLDLAVAAGTTPRHLSLIETGRSRPRRDLILRIADALTVPLAERNTLLAAAGLPRSFPRTSSVHVPWNQSTGSWTRCWPATNPTRHGSSASP
jgi:DNA-binding XRE family transcriptional regulator